MSEGDQVLIEAGRTAGQILELIETDAQMKNWNVNEPGVMVKSAPFGLVFWPSSSEDPLVFVSRGKEA